MDILPCNSGRAGQRSAAFTLIECVVLIAMIGLLSLLLLPALARTKVTNHGVVCLSNSKRLMAAIHLYAADNNDLWVPNEPGQTAGWVKGSLNFNSSNQDNTNTYLLLNPKFAKLGPYTRDANLYRCPSDKSTVKFSNGDTAIPRVRSVSMNHAVGTLWESVCSRGPGDPVSGEWLTGQVNKCQTRWRTYGKTSQMTFPSPANLWVVMDEHPDSINDEVLLVQCQLTGFAGTIVDFPGSLHDGGAGVAFADGHSEIHRWQDNRTKPPVTYTGTLPLNIPSPNNPDVTWLQQHTSALRP